MQASWRAVQDGLGRRGRLDPDDIGALARLVTIGERRDPRAFLDAVRPAWCWRSLAAAVIAGRGGVRPLRRVCRRGTVLDPEPADLGDDHGGYLGADVRVAGRGAGQGRRGSVASQRHAVQTGVSVSSPAASTSSVVASVTSGP